MLRVNIRFIGHSMEVRRQLQAHVEKGIPAVVLIPPSEADTMVSPGADLGRATSKVLTFKVLEISQEGCTFTSSSPEGLTSGANLRIRIVADELVLELDSRVVHVSRAA